MLRHEVHAPGRWIGRYKLGNYKVSDSILGPSGINKIEWWILPDRAMHSEKKDPENQHQTAVAGPPAASGEDQVPGTTQSQTISFQSLVAKDPLPTTAEDAHN
jgi:hypothetical protein